MEIFLKYKNANLKSFSGAAINYNKKYYLMFVCFNSCLLSKKCF